MGTIVIRANQLKCAAFELPFAGADDFGGEDTPELLQYLAKESGILAEVENDPTRRWKDRDLEALGIATTAEGVETSEQLDRVISEGCSQVQGFLYGPATMDKPWLQDSDPQRSEMAAL